MRSYKFRLYPTKAQRNHMGKHLVLAKDLWNELLAHNKRTYTDFGKFSTKNTLITMTKQYGLFSQTQQEIAGRIDKSIRRFLKLKKQGKECGFPRFKSIDRMKSLNYPQAGFRLKGKKLYTNPFGEINIRKHREIDGKIKTLSLKRMPTGKWFAVFAVEQSEKEPRKNNGQKVGIDLGLRTLATTSDGIKIENPRHLKNKETELAFIQRKFSRKIRRSKNWKKHKIKVAKIHEKITDTRNDFHHKLSRQLVEKYSLIALEKLNSKNMAEQNYGKHIHDAGWASLTNMLCYKAEEAGCKIIFVNPHNTTKTCNKCGKLQDMELADRTYWCKECGMVEDRDINAAKNILAKATAGMAESNAFGDAEETASMNKEAHDFSRG